MIQVAPHHAWNPESRVAVRGQVLLRMRPGEAPGRVPSQREIREGRMSAALGLDGGPVDRAILRWSPRLRVSRVFQPARTIGGSNGGSNGGRPDWDAVEHELGLSRCFRVHMDPTAPVLPVLEALRALGTVEQVSPNYLCTAPFALPDPTHPSGRRQPDPLWPWHMVGADRALAAEPGDSALIVGVIDSGAALDHPELGPALRPGLDTVQLSSARMNHGMELFGDFDGVDRDPRDEMGHGTATAGIIAARGLHLPRGLGGACRILPVRAMAGAHVLGRGQATAVGSIADIDEGMKAAVDLGARVLNLSFGTPASSLRPDDDIPHAEVVAYASARGCILVAASGNSGQSERYYPACLPQVIAVGAVGSDGLPCSFSTTGSHVLLCAPGEHIRTLALQGYCEQSGTSFAAPFVTAACALLSARAARYSHALTPALVRDALRASVRPFSSGVRPTGCGAGILDVPAALSHLEQTLRLTDPALSPTSAPAALGA